METLLLNYIKRCITTLFLKDFYKDVYDDLENNKS